MTLEQLIGILQTYEMNHIERDSDKTIALKSQLDFSDDDLSEQEIAYLTKKVARMLQSRRAKNLKQKKFQQTCGLQEVQTFDRPQNAKYKGKSKIQAPKRPNGIKGIICFECGGKCHIKSECPTAKRKNLKATWSDDSSTSDESESDAEDIIAFTAQDDDRMSQHSSDSNELVEFDQQELLEAYIGVCEDLKEAVVKHEKIKERNYFLEKQINEVTKGKSLLSEELLNMKIELTKVQESKELLPKDLIESASIIEKLQRQMDESNEVLSKLNKGKVKLDEVLSIEKISGDQNGIGYQVGSTSKTREFVSGGLLQPKFITNQTAVRQKSRLQVTCRYCFLVGHSTNQCYKCVRDILHGKNIDWISTLLNIKYKRVWKIKNDRGNLICNVLFSVKDSDPKN